MARSDVPLTPYFVSPESTNTWRRRSKQIVADPDSIEWITGVIWDIDRKLAVGRAGFHAPPDADGMVEVGYAVDPAYRRQGYARAALEALLARAAVETGVRTVRVSVRPGQRRVGVASSGSTASSKLASNGMTRTASNSSMRFQPRPSRSARDAAVSVLRQSRAACTAQEATIAPALRAAHSRLSAPNR